MSNRAHAHRGASYAVRLTLLVGAHAHRLHLGGEDRGNLTANVLAWRDFLPRRIPLPHPSPRNVAWFKRNPWFETGLLPELRNRVAEALAEPV